MEKLGFTDSRAGRDLRARALIGECRHLGASIAPVGLALSLWVIGLRSIDIGRMTDIGLISVLPVPTFVAIVAILASAGYQLHREVIDGRSLAVHVIALVVVLYGIPSIVENAARTSTVWTHLGFAEYIERTGRTAPELDARMNWPGFFVGAAFLASLVGQGMLVTIADWSGVIFNLLYLLPLVVIVDALVHDRKVVWASALAFVITNWIGQDYFAPQALAYFLYLAIVAVVATWFLVPQPASEGVRARIRALPRGGRLLAGAYDLFTPEERAAPRLSGRQRVAAMTLLIIVFAFIASSHQLTPFVTVSALIALLLFGRVSLRAIPVLFGVMTVAWVSYMTVPFLAGHVASLINEVGRVGSTLSESVTSRIGGSADHHLVVTIRLMFTIALWALAALGALIRYRDGRRDLTLLLLAAAPFPLLGLQAYGGEIVLRLYLFSLPFVAILVVGLVYGRPAGGPSARASVLTVLAACFISLGFIVARYGNERFDLMTGSEVAAVETLYQTAPAGSSLFAVSFSLPWKFDKVEQYQYVSADVSLDVTAIEKLMRDPKYPNPYLILTASQGAFAETFIGLPAGSWDRFLAQIDASPLFRTIYRNEDSQILVLTGPPTATRP